MSLVKDLPAQVSKAGLKFMVEIDAPKSVWVSALFAFMLQQWPILVSNYDLR